MPFGYGGIPYYEGFRFSIDMSEEEQMEKDKEYMKNLYPSQAKAIQAMVDEECDKLEYEGSVMFDEYPDKIAMKRISMDIFVKFNQEDENRRMDNTQDEDLYVMNYNFGRRPLMPGPGQNPVMDMIDILLFNEIYKRRCRHNRCRRRLYW
jgi:hypothetical protein